MSDRWRAWLGEVLTHAVGSALGAMIAAPVLVLGAALLGLIGDVDWSQYLALVVSLLGVAAGLATARRSFERYMESWKDRVGERYMEAYYADLAADADFEAWRDEQGPPESR